jgi:ribose transport system substrate-binding protein
MDKIRRHLRHSPPRRTVVLAGNDPMALGAIRAFEECGRAGGCAVMGQNASLEARREMRRRDTRLVGSVAYFPERYGDQAIRLAAALLAKRPVPPAVFTKHELVTPENVDRLYPFDEVLPEVLAGPMIP